METKTRILIADANPDISSLVSDLIAGEGDMEVVGTADNGADALALIGELKPDVLLLDLVLSKLDGLELLRRLGEVERRPQVIVLSGFVNGKVVGECSALGADYFKRLISCLDKSYYSEHRDYASRYIATDLNSIVGL